jgi:thymidylate synthase (FAD)
MKTAKIEVTYIDHSGTDINIVNAARVSFAKESKEDVFYTDVLVEDYEGKLVKAQEIGFRLNEADTKLVRYLAKHNHKSPFNHVFISFRVKAPIFVARQLVKHEYLPWNEVSRRYVTEEPEFYFPDYWRKAADNVKQGSSDKTIIMVRGRDGSGARAPDLAEQTTRHALMVYNYLLEGGVCPEQARMILPQNTMTEWVWSGTLYAFAKMCKLRLDSHTQKETQEVAKLIEAELLQCYPVSYAALKEFM